MAATSTNKQPLLVDRVLHNIIDLNTAVVGAINVAGTNTALLVVDATQSDGCIIESIYCISRASSEYTINLYMSNSSDYLRPGEGIFIGSFKSATTKGNVTTWDEAPKILAPMPQTGTEQQFRALYIPKGRTLWAAREEVGGGGIVDDGPILGAQGGWY
jgi:hypothetical protein